MKKMTRLLALVMAIALVLSLSVTAFASEYYDVGYYDPSLGSPYTAEIKVSSGETNINWFNCYGADGYTATVSGAAGVTVSHNGEEYTTRMDTQELSFTLVGDPMMRGMAQLTFVNLNDYDVALTVTIEAPAGTGDAEPDGSVNYPYALVMGDNTADVGAYSEVYYTWTAEENGELTLSPACDDWFYAVATIEHADGTYSYGDAYYSTWGDTGIQTLSIVKGDVLTIAAGTGTGKAGTVTLNAAFKAEEAPVDAVSLGNNFVTVRENYMGMGKMYEITAPSDGHITLTVNGVTSYDEPMGMMAIMMSGVSVYVNNVTVNEANGDEAASISNYTDGAALPVSAGDVISVQVTAGRGVDFEIDFDLTLSAHTWDEGEETTPSTCTEAGVVSYTCTACGATKEEAAELADHTPVVDAAVPATCTETGLTEGSHCGVCDVIIVAQEEVPVIDHTPVVDAAVPATCTETGLTEGSHCSVCDTVIVAQEEVPVVDHTPVVDAAVAPSCTETGLTEGSHCSVCDAVIVAQEEVPVVDHTPETDAAVAPTCTKPGLTEGSHCSVCDAVIVAQQEVPATGHTPVVDAAVPATCTNTGLTEGSHCEVCDEVIVAQKTVSKLAHTYGEDDACTVCGTKKPAADSPATGDASLIMFVLMTASAIGMGGAYGLNKKYRFI